MHIPPAHPDLERLERIIEQTEAHVRAKRLNAARESLREAQALKIKIFNRIAIEKSLQDKYNRAMH